jgi:hypothetical protein
MIGSVTDILPDTNEQIAHETRIRVNRGNFIFANVEM